MVSKVSVNLSSLKDLEKAFKGMAGKSMQAGWFESATYDNGTPIAGVAAVQEFGSVKRSIPAAGFMRQTVDNQQGAWAELVKSGTKAVLEGKATYEQVINGLGLQVQGDIQESIVNTNRPALSPITIALRRLRNDGVKVGGALVGAVAAAIAKGETGFGQLGDQTFGNKTPLNDSGMMIATVTYEVS